MADLQMVESRERLISQSEGPMESWSTISQWRSEDPSQVTFGSFVFRLDHAHEGVAYIGILHELRIGPHELQVGTG